MSSTHISGFDTDDYNNLDNNNFDDYLSSDKYSSDQSNYQMNMQAFNQSNILENSYPKNFFDNFSPNDQQKIQFEQQQNELISNFNINSSEQSHLSQGIQVNQDQCNVVKPVNKNNRIPIRQKVIIRKQKLLEKQRNGQITQQIEEEVFNQNQESARSEIDKNVNEELEKESSSNSVTTKRSRGKTTKQITKNKDNFDLENEEEFLNLDKKTQQKIKNRISAQKSRDDKKYQLQHLKNENSKLSEDVKQLVEENQQLKEKLKNNICFKCQSQSSIDDCQSEDDYIRQSSPIQMRRSNSNYFNFYGISTAQLALIFCVCLIVVQMDKTQYQQFQSATPNVFIQVSKCEMPNCNQNQVVEYEIPNDNKADQNPLSLIQGIDQNNFQDDIIINTKLLNGFGKPGSSLDLMYLQQNRQNDEIICPNSYVLLYSKDPNEKHNIINLTLTNQTNFYSAYDGQYYPLYQDGQQGQIKLTCLVLKYEQISGSQQNL
ncbi:hypothetical protein ABPG74_017806 [Tetrahymena malaccensis]